jgi:transcriptional regulator with XRE-family HTH domain
MASLKEIRKKFGVTQIQVAETTGIDMFELSWFENGRPTTLENMISLEQYFGIPLDWLEPLYNREKLQEYIK